MLETWYFKQPVVKRELRRQIWTDWEPELDQGYGLDFSVYIF